MPKNHLFGLCNQFLSNSMSIVFNFRAGFGDVQSIIVKIAHAKTQEKEKDISTMDDEEVVKR